MHTVRLKYERNKDQRCENKPKIGRNVTGCDPKKTECLRRPAFSCHSHIVVQFSPGIRNEILLQIFVVTKRTRTTSVNTSSDKQRRVLIVCLCIIQVLLLTIQHLHKPHDRSNVNHSIHRSLSCLHISGKITAFTQRSERTHAAGKQTHTFGHLCSGA